jgi:hypothetical protein
MAAKRGKTKAKPRAKSSHGGPRPGSGRKPSTVKEIRDRIVAETDKEICRHLPQLIKNMLYLANGGYERVEEKWTPPQKTTKEMDGREIELSSEAQLIERKVSWAEPDRAANQYLIDRILGKPKQAVEVGGPDGGQIPLSIEAAIAKVYGEAAAT